MSVDLRLVVSEAIGGDGPVKIRCINPNHHDPAASLAVYRDNLNCFGCGFHINDWDEALSLLLGVSQVEAREVASRYSSERADAYRERVTAEARRDPMPMAYAKMYHEFLRSTMRHRITWLRDRGLTWKTLSENLIGHTGTHFTIPVFDKEKRLLTIRFRKDDAIVPDEYELWNGEVYRVPKYVGWSGRNGLYLYGEHWLEVGGEVWICEGELDALRLHQEEKLACSATNGALQVRNVPSLLSSLCPSVRTVVVATDTDKAGEEAAVQVIQAASRLGMKTYRAFWWGKYKDVTEALQAGEEIGTERVYG